MAEIYNNGNHIWAIEFNTTCGANCIMCPRENHLKKWGKFEVMPMDFFKKAVDQCVSYGIVNLSGGFGDVLIDPHFVERMEYMKGNYPQIQYSVVVTGHMLSGEMADAVCKYVDILKISHYGMTKQVFESIHRGSLQFESVKKMWMSS